MLDTVRASEIREGVRATFNAVGETPAKGFRFPVGAQLARHVGYPDEVLSSLPLAVYESFTGVAYLFPHLNLRPGEHVLDLGSGGGLDAILAARIVAPTGTVTGLDFAEGMISRARAVAATLCINNVGFVQGSAEAIPLANEVFDAVLVNGLLNLCPDKAAVAREIFRVLKPGGRGVVAEITYTDPLPPAAVRTIDDWFR